jgi:TatD family hydrolase
MDVSFDDEYVLPDVNVAMAAAKSVNVTKVIQVGCDVASSKWAAKTALEHPDVWATVALHPNAAAHDTDLESSLAEIAELAKLPQVRGLGETGLDYYRTEESQAAAQHVSFRAHIDIAREVGKPVIIHDRDAHKDVIETLETHGAPETVVFHCFSGDAADGKDLCRSWLVHVDTRSGDIQECTATSRCGPRNPRSLASSRNRFAIFNSCTESRPGKCLNKHPMDSSGNMRSSRPI